MGISGISGSQVVGTYGVVKGSFETDYAFLYNGSSYTKLLTQLFDTHPTGIFGNTVVGTFQGANAYHGFSSTGGNYKTIDPPGSHATYVTSISGDYITGSYQIDPNSDDVYHSFLFDGANYTTIDPPGSTSSLAAVVSGPYVAGTFSTDSSDFASRGYFFDGANFTTINPPGSELVTIAGIRVNQVFGSYTKSSGGGLPYYGFVATVGQSSVVRMANLAGTYNGSPQAVAVTTSPPGLSTNVTYASGTAAPSSTPPTAAGSYNVTAIISTVGYNGTATGTLSSARPPPRSPSAT